MNDTITKRLHISGLTPALTADDISKRLSSFGTVKAIDGFGLRDAVERPRKFGYVTLETTQPKLHKCLNTLSGSTWKGAKLRIGEAKPDFAERLALEHESNPKPPRKKRRKNNVHASDMSIVTPENVASRSGWKVTPLGRILRPMRMRPGRPLPPPSEHKGHPTRGMNLKKKSKRVKTPDERARRRKIDMTRYGSNYLKGMFLEMDVLGTRRDETRDTEKGSESESASQDGIQGVINIAVDQATPPAKIVRPVDKATGVPAVPMTETMESMSHDLDIATENVQSLSLLASIFGDNNDQDWIGRESFDSDVDEAQLTKNHRPTLNVDSEDFEIVRMDADVDSERPQVPLEVEGPVPIPLPLPTLKQQQAKNLKDLFAPREDDATFSLLGHLELDLELDDEIPFAIPEGASIQEPAQTTPNVTQTSTIAVSNYPVPQLNSKLPLFFPLDSAFSSQQNLRARPRDVFDVARENRWHWRDRSVGFFRTGTEEEIREQWENSKVELTREWKRRWKEAGKISRRKRHGADEYTEGVGG